MHEPTAGPVVVGVDGSPGSLDALEWAVLCARDLGVPLRVVHAWRAPAPILLPTMPPGRPLLTDDRLAEVAERGLGAAAARARELAPDVDVVPDLREGPAHAVLAEASRGAARVVVGVRRHGGLSRLALGSVGTHLPGHAACPVVVVRRPPAPDGPVLVGIDRVERAEPLLALATAEARRTARQLRVVHVWAWPAWIETGTALLPDLEDEAQRVLAGLLQDWRGRHPDVDVLRRVVEGHPQRVLVEEARTASLLVVGSRGHDPVVELLLGSVARGVVQAAPCPVVVVPTGRRAEGVPEPRDVAPAPDVRR